MAPAVPTRYPTTVRRTRPSSPATALLELGTLMRAGTGLRLLQARLPPGSTLADARRARERILQLGRRPCTFLDRELGIDRG